MHAMWDLFAEDTGELDEDGVPIIVCRTIGTRALNTVNDDEIRGTVDRLAAREGTMSIGDYMLWQQAVGFNNEPHGILRNDRLRNHVRPASQYCHDWMHAMMVSGVMDKVIFALLQAVKTVVPDIYKRLYDYIGQWEWPSFRSHGKTVRDLFLRKREVANAAAKTFKAMASEMLGLYPILSLFLTRTIIRSGECVPECTAFIVLCDVVDLLLVANIGKCTPDELKASIEVFFQTCRDANWVGLYIPKFHWLEHLHSHLAAYGCLPTCWVHERKHRVAKRYATSITNTTEMERSLLGEIVCHNLFDINRPNIFDLEPGIFHPIQADAKVVAFVREHIDADAQPEEIKKGFKARITPAGFVARGDVALVRSVDGHSFICGKIWIHLEIRDAAVTVFQPWKTDEFDRNLAYADWTVGGMPILVDTKDILAPVVYCDVGNGVTRTIIPWLYRKHDPADK